MSYIGSAAGVIPVSFSGVNSQSFNGDGSTVAFTLNRPVATVKDVEVVVNNVQQSPYDGSYSVTGSTLTFSAAPSTGTANVYVTFRDQPVGTLTDTTAVSKSGDTMTGNLIVNANVGVGTTPSVKLDVYSSTWAQAKVRGTGGSGWYGSLDFSDTGPTTVWRTGARSNGEFWLEHPSGAAGSIAFKNLASNGESVRITSDGYLRMASGSGGIQFNGDTAAANALDDYEEGTFTPDLVNNGGTSTWAVKVGRYVKVGAQINFWCYFDAGGPGSGGAMFLSNLPFVGSGTASTMSTVGTIVTNLGASSTSWYPAFQSASNNTLVIWTGTGQVIGQSINFALVQGSYNAF